MKNVNWEAVQDEVRRPVPGGYAAKITRVEDVEEKEYLRIEWDFADGEFKGSNQETMTALGFWPYSFVQSYKDTALRFFKGFKTAVENSNPNFVFKNDPQSLVGKFVGVVLAEEEYVSNAGQVKTRLYVAEKRSGKAIREGDFKVPDLKKLDPSKLSSVSAPAPAYAAPVQSQGFVPITVDDDELPFN